MEQCVGVEQLLDGLLRRVKTLPREIELTEDCMKTPGYKCYDRTALTYRKVSVNTGRPFTVHVQYPYTLPAQDRWPHGNYMYVAEGEAEAEAEAEANVQYTFTHAILFTGYVKARMWGEAGGGAGNRST